MYSKLPNLVLGFHGCDISVCESVLGNNEVMKRSSNTYDWLGNGIYFWENSFQRAVDWADAAAKRPHTKVKTPAVIGAVIDLGYCLNLMDYGSSDILRQGYEMLSVKCNLAGVSLPTNRNVGDNHDLLLRDLDCAVIQQIHAFHHEKNIPDYDSVRGAFIEGEPIYSGSGFREKTHIQICITNPNCIKGYFYPQLQDLKFTVP